MPPPCLTLPVFMIYWQRCKGCFDCNLCHDQERCPSGRRSQTRNLVWGSSSPWVRIPLTPFFIVLRRRGFRQPRLSFFGIALGWFSSFLRFFALTEEIFLPKFVFSNLLKKTLDVSMVLKNDFLDLLHVHRLLKSVLQCHTPPINAIQSPTVPYNAHKIPKRLFISYNCPIYVKNNARHCQTTGSNSRKKQQS